MFILRQKTYAGYYENLGAKRVQAENLFLNGVSDKAINEKAVHELKTGQLGGTDIDVIRKRLAKQGKTLTPEMEAQIALKRKGRLTSSKVEDTLAKKAEFKKQQVSGRSIALSQESSRKKYGDLVDKAVQRKPLESLTHPQPKRVSVPKPEILPKASPSLSFLSKNKVGLGIAGGLALGAGLMAYQKNKDK